MDCYLREGTLCTVTYRECEGGHCRAMGEEERRLQVVLDGCPYSTRRRGENEVWCHAKGEPHVCFGWPEECPEHLRRQLAQYKRLFGKRVGHCARCGEMFFVARPWGREKRFCSARCKSTLQSRKRRQRQKRRQFRRRAADRSARMQRKTLQQRAYDRLHADATLPVCGHCPEFQGQEMVRRGKRQVAPWGGCRVLGKAVRRWSRVCAERD